jgi:acetyl-CoA C-acetyltransferase
MPFYYDVVTAPRLGAHAISNAIERSGIDSSSVQEAFMGHVVPAGVGQAPTRQAVIYSGLHLDVPSTSINKVCASGMKAVMTASLSVQAGYRDVVIAGGMESMSNIPYYLPGARTGYRLGNNTVIDGLVHDGLWDVYNNQHMGMCGEICADKYKFSREDQDEYALMSYERAAKAWEAGLFNEEVAPIGVPTRRGQPDEMVSTDEEFTNIKIDKVKTLKPAFKKDGTVTAANASTINDGAAAMVVMSGKAAREQGANVLFKIRGFGTHALLCPVCHSVLCSSSLGDC